MQTDAQSLTRRMCTFSQLREAPWTRLSHLGNLMRKPCAGDQAEQGHFVIEGIGAILKLLEPRPKDGPSLDEKRRRVSAPGLIAQGVQLGLDLDGPPQPTHPAVLADLAGDELGARDGREIAHMWHAPEATYPERLNGGVGQGFETAGATRGMFLDRSRNSLFLSPSRDTRRHGAGRLGAALRHCAPAAPDAAIDPVA